MKRFHIAIGVTDLSRSIADYSIRLGCKPCVVVPDEYALWRTDSLNFSIRVTETETGSVRHLGWEDPAASGFSSTNDVNGILWERFTAEQQADEIRELWPDAEFEKGA
jgi:hypothetical protein